MHMDKQPILHALYWKDCILLLLCAELAQGFNSLYNTNAQVLNTWTWLFRMQL
jgi:hypothetical protein